MREKKSKIKELDKLIINKCMTEKILKVGLPISKKGGFVFVNENLLKMMKNDLYFTLKSLFGLIIIKFLPFFFWSFRKMA